jgi:hypothetical protein
MTGEFFEPFARFPTVDAPLGECKGVGQLQGISSGNTLGTSEPRSAIPSSKMQNGDPKKRCHALITRGDLERLLDASLASGHAGLNSL